MNRFFYSVLLYLISPFLILRLLWRSRKLSAYSKRIFERFGFNLPKISSGGVWIHAVSVGESITAVPMIKAIRLNYPEISILVTCTTPTGSESLTRLLKDINVQHCYLPYDLPWSVSRFLNKTRPKIALIVETELWPNYVAQCAKRKIKQALINARLSEKSAKGYSRISRITEPMLKSLDLIAVQTAVESQRFIDLGAKLENIEITGSLKFDIKIDSSVVTKSKQLKTLWKTTKRPVWIAASTHEGEDELILQAHRTLLLDRPDALLLLVPRHPERFDVVFDLCESQLFNVRRYSEGPNGISHQIIVGNVMGELLALYSMADIAFVGGSLIPRGGHNLLEPIALGKPVLTGPHCFNFFDIYTQLSEEDALITVNSASCLSNEIAMLWSSPDKAQLICKKSTLVLKRNQGALQRILHLISNWLVN
ncbi:UNVERIFIED_CONTAM: hypothetical protein GTU68_000693 [Idotea baltica]|nr:hypothetical protein [Idotea baltica]